MTSALRERATDQFDITHEVISSGRNLLITRCDISGQWKDKDHDFPGDDDFQGGTMAWDKFDPKPDVTCMACLVREAQR